MKSAIVSAVVALSQAIGSTTVVEGVETVAQLDEVKNLGCDVAQGFYLPAPCRPPPSASCCWPTRTRRLTSASSTGRSPAQPAVRARDDNAD